MGSGGSGLDKGEGPTDRGINQPNRPFAAVPSGRKRATASCERIARQRCRRFVGFHLNGNFHGWLLIKMAAWVGAPFPGSNGCHDSTCSMRVLSCASRQTLQGPRKPTQQANGVATMTHWPKRGSLSLTEMKAVAPIHGFVFIVPTTSGEGRMAANTSFAQQQCL
jgi:hypothetical protein